MMVMQALIGGAKLVYGLPAYVLLGLAGVAAVGLSPKRSTGRVSSVCVATAAILVGYVVWRSMTSPIEYLARSDFYMVLAGVVGYGLGSIHLAGSKSRMLVVWIILGLAMVHIAVGVVQFQEGKNYMLLPWIFRPDYGARASGFYICPNHLAGLMEFASLLALSVSIWGRVKTWVRIVSVYFFVVCFVGLAITGSRGGYLSIVGGLVAFGILSLWTTRHLKRRWFWGALLIGIAALGGTVAVAVTVMSKSALLENRLSQVWDPTNMRVHMWQAAIEAHNISPTFGTGSGTYLYYGRHFRDPSVQNDAQHVHSDYLELYSEYGNVGCVIMGLFLLAHFGSGISGLRGLVRLRLRPARITQSNELALLVGALAGLWSIALHSVIDFNLHIPANVVICGFLLGVLANPRSAGSDETLAWRINGEWVRFLTPLTAGVLIALSVPWITSEYYGERARMSLRDQVNAEAVRYASLAIERDPKNYRSHYYLGEAKHNLAMLEQDAGARQKLNTEAALAFAEGLKHFPTDLQLLLKLARTLDNLNRFGEAELVYQQAMLADPNFGNVYAYWGHHYFLLRKLIRAEKLYRKAISLQEREISPLGLQDIEKYRQMAANEDNAAFYPIDDDESDLAWEPGDP